MSFYQDIKILITDVLPLTHDALHVLSGLILHLAACTLRRRPLHWVKAGLFVLVIAMLAEAMDFAADQRIYGFWIWRESVKDILLTIAPSVLLVAQGKLFGRY